MPGNLDFSSSTDVRINNDPPLVSNTQSNDTTISAGDTVCISATVTSPGANLEHVWCKVTDPTEFVMNYTMTDTGCGGAVDDVYEVEIQMNIGGVWFINTTYGNDTDALEGFESPFPDTEITVTSHLYIEGVEVTPILTGFGHNISINANVTGDLSVDSVLANVTYPNGSWDWYELYWQYDDKYSVNFTETWQNGNYSSVYIWANISDGFSNDTSGEPKYFEVLGNATFDMKMPKQFYIRNENVTIIGEGDWWNTTWRYRKPIKIEERTNTELTEYQVLLFINTSGLIDEGKMNNDCSDIRFVNSTGYEMEYFLDFGYIDCNQQNTTFWVQIPILEASQNNTIYMYYGNISHVASQSNEIEVFSYNSLTTTAYVGDNRTAAGGLNVTSYADSNQIYDGTTTHNLDQGESEEFPSSELSAETEIQSLKPFSSSIASSSDGDEAIPISFAGNKFLRYCRRSTCDFDIISPFGIANVTICIGTGSCQSQVLDQGSHYNFMGYASSTTTVHIFSNISVLAHAGTEEGNEDFLSLIPIYSDMINYTRKNGNWTYWGVPSARLHNAAGEDGADITCYRSVGNVFPLTLGPWEVDAQTGLGSDGTSPAYMCESTDIFYTVQEADGDGTESTTFLPEFLLDYEFFLPAEAEYFSLATKHRGTNCTIYNDSGEYVNSSISTGGGDYPYPGFIFFNVTSEHQRGYRIVCNNSAFVYFERLASNGETNLYGPKANMKYIEPMPMPYAEEDEEEVSSAKVNNTGTLDIKIYLLMQIHTNITGTWETVSTQVDDTTPRTITSHEILNLTEIFVPWNTTNSDGATYRVYVALVDPYGTVLLNDTGGGLNATAYFTIAETVIIDGDFTTGDEWSSTGGCGENDWLISDPDDVSPDTSDIEMVYSQSGGTYLYVAVQFLANNGELNTTIWFDNPTYDGIDDYNVTIKPGFTGIQVWDLSTDTPTDHDNDGTDYVGHSVSTNLTEFRIPKSSIGSPSTTNIYVTTTNDRANDTGYLEHDFTSCTGPANPIPEFPFGAIVALLISLFMLSLFKRSKV